MPTKQDLEKELTVLREDFHANEDEARARVEQARLLTIQVYDLRTENAKMREVLTEIATYHGQAFEPAVYMRNLARQFIDDNMTP